jgi:hypothetical protein
MNSNTMAPWYHGGRIYGHAPLLLAAICLFGGLQATLPVNAAETGIRGTVMWGPVHGGPVRVGQSEEAPLSASFLVFGSETKVASFESDDKGHFEITLPAGEYTIVPDKSTPMPFPRQQKKTVTVPEDGFAEVTLRFDTGMR